VVLVLALTALYAFGAIFDLGLTRFFSIDEYQYGHATWLVSRGALPYVDFFEHHFPLSYVLHAPLYWVDWSFADGALLLRKIVLAYLFAAAALAGLAAWFTTRDAATALISSFVPTTVGFGLMSSVEYRSENFGAFCLLACLLLLDWNRRQDSTRLAACCGLLAAAAACMTQKMTFIAGVTLATMWTVDLLTQRTASGAAGAHRMIARPAIFFGVAVGFGVAALAIGAALGILGAGFEATIQQAALHEQVYERFSLLERGYATVYWQTTWPSTVPLILLAAAHISTRAGRFWAFPIAASLLGGALMVAPYPYNFVFLCWVVAITAARGLGDLVGLLTARSPALAVPAPLLYLLAVPVLANQLGYVAGSVTNEHQLATLSKIEQFGEPGDAVIDNAGGAMFSEDGSYYFHHGAAHRVMFRDYFETQLILDYRDSRALFWIPDFRTKQLPQPTQHYLESHYIRGDGDLHVLGFETPKTGPEAATQTIEVIRAGDYYIHRANPPPPGRPARETDLLLDGAPLRQNRLFLHEREYTVTARPHSPRYLITPVKSSFFSVGDRESHDERDGARDEESRDERRPRFSMLFQHHAQRARAEPDAPELD
jgi:hypothetical protein